MTIRFDRALAAAAALLICADAGAQLAAGEFDRRIDVDEPVTLEVSTGSGSIDIRRGAPGEVRVHGRISVARGFRRSEAEAEELVSRLESEPPIVVDGSRIEIGRIVDDELRRNVSISYDIVVPAETTATSRTGSGNQTLSGLSGAVSATTGSGDIIANAVGGGADLRTGSGSIDASEIDGAFNARTGSGSIRLASSRAGDVDVSSGSGNIELGGFQGALTARTGSGSITAAGTPSGPWSVQTGSGSIDVRIPAGTGFEVDAHTGSGRIQVEQQVTTSGTLERNSLRGRVGSGGPLLKLRTGSGGIRIAEQ